MSIPGATSGGVQLSSQGGATRFKKGQKRSPRAGRRSGVPNKATQEIKDVCRSLTFGNPKVFERVRRECETGKINPAVFIALLYLGYGKPKPAKDEVAQPRRPLWIVLSRPLGYDPLADELGSKSVGSGANAEEAATAVRPEDRGDVGTDADGVEALVPVHDIPPRPGTPTVRW